MMAFYCPECEACLGTVVRLGDRCEVCGWETKLQDLIQIDGNPATKTPSPTVGSMIGIGGAPTRATTLPTEGSERKKYPVASGVLDYFPDAIALISKVSWTGNEQHNPGKPLHWDRSKSQDEADTLIRHFLQRGTVDSDGIPHSAKVAWRALAMLQKEIENADV